MSNVVAPTTGFPSSRAKQGWRETLQTQMRVLHAIVLHDIKSRFLGNGLGYIGTILWPAVHLAVIIAIYYYTGRQAPYGDSALLYASIGVLPFIIWSYVSRFTLLGVAMNRSFLQYPIVKPLDLMIGRQALELVTSTIIVAALAAFLLVCGIDPVPHRVDQAVFALMATALLGIGFGIAGGVLTMIFPLFQIFYVFLVIITWTTCGLVFDPETMPTQIASILAWNPVLHCIEWMRYAYYDDFPARILDRTYLLVVGAGSLAIGLIMERAFRVFTTQ